MNRPHLGAEAISAPNDVAALVERERKRQSIIHDLRQQGWSFDACERFADEHLRLGLPLKASETIAKLLYERFHEPQDYPWPTAVAGTYRQLAQEIIALSYSSALEASEAKIAALTAENATLREERHLADNSLVDRYRDPKTGTFQFPTDVAAIVRRLDAVEAEITALREALEIAKVFMNSRMRLNDHGERGNWVLEQVNAALALPASERAAFRQEGKP